MGKSHELRADQSASQARALSAGSGAVGNHGVIFGLEGKRQRSFSNWKVCVVDSYSQGHFVCLCVTQVLYQTSSGESRCQS